VESVTIPDNELKITTMLAGGKGGQNVNKVFFFFITLKPRVEWYKSLWASNTRPPRNRGQGGAERQKRTVPSQGSRNSGYTPNYGGAVSYERGTPVVKAVGSATPTIERWPMILGGYHESRKCSRDTYPESYITKYTSMRRLTHARPLLQVETAVRPGKALRTPFKSQLAEEFVNFWR